MTERLPIEPPASVTAHFVVAAPGLTTAGADDAGAAWSLTGDVAARRAGGPLAGAARELIEASRLAVRAGPAATSGWQARLRGVAGPRAETARLPGASRHIVVTSTGPPPAGPGEAQAARFVARSIAIRTAGVVVDVTANQVLAGGDPRDAPCAESDAFVLGDDWLAVFVNLDEAATTAGRMRIETAGLARFALPELIMREVPLGRVLTAVNIVRALAYRLLRDCWAWRAGHPDEPVWWAERERYAAAADVWRYWGARPAGGGGVRVRLGRCAAWPPGEVAPLEIIPSDAPAGDAWWAEVAAPAIPLLTSAPRAPVVLLP